MRLRRDLLQFQDKVSIQEHAANLWEGHAADGQVAESANNTMCQLLCLVMRFRVAVYDYNSTLLYIQDWSPRKTRPSSLL